MARKQIDYVDIDTGVIWSKHEGAEVKPNLIPVSREQALRICEGEPVAEVLKDRAIEEVTVDLSTPDPKSDLEPVKEPEPELTDIEKIEAMDHWKQVSSFAKEKGVDFPEGNLTVEERKKFLIEALSKE